MKDGKMEYRELIRKYMKGVASYTEEKKLLQWLTASSENEKKFNDEKKTWEENIEHDKNYSAMLNQKWNHVKTKALKMEIVSEDERKPKRTIKLNVLLRYAAAIILLIGISSVIYYFTGTNSRQIPEFVFQAVQNLESENTYLILANGDEVVLKGTKPVVEYNEEGTEILLNSDSVVTQNNPISQEIAYNQMIVPFGKTASIVLSDGTKVWLNAGSKLVYPPVFATDKREVFIVGEALFEVTKNRNKPFFVKTKDLNIRVLGTSFNVKAYFDDANIETVLVSGRIQLEKAESGWLDHKKTILLPSQLADFDKESKVIDVRNVNVESYISWKDGWYKLDKLPLVQVVEKLERYYNIKILIPDKDVRQIKITGKLELKDTIEQVLENIVLTLSLNYKIENNTVSIYKNSL